MSVKCISSRSFRLVCRADHCALVEELLREQGFVFEAEAFSPLARRLVYEPFPLGASLAARFGYIYIQDRSSMLPPLALAPAEGAGVLDLCASPGSKTGLLAQLVGQRGCVLGNEPNPKRLATLRHNLLQLNLPQVVSSSVAGEKLPLPDASWRYILLDPPCSAWGTSEKHPKVTQIWKEDKLRPLVHLQRRLLREASRLLAPGGRLVYSTCTTNPEENEEQLAFAQDELGLELVPLAPFAGFSFAAPARGAEGSLLVDGQASGAQGFFVALLGKAADAGAAVRPGPPLLPDGADYLPCDLLDQDTRRLLPPGKLLLRNNQVFFMPRAALDLIAPGLRWQGCVLGTYHKGRLRLAPRLHFLLPPQAGQGSINLDELAPIEDLLAGRSLECAAGGKESLLYWRGLPLARLRVRGTRAIWSA